MQWNKRVSAKTEFPAYESRHTSGGCVDRVMPALYCHPSAQDWDDNAGMTRSSNARTRPSMLTRDGARHAMSSLDFNAQSSSGATGMNTSSQVSDKGFELWFRPLSIAAPALAFACDASGHVDLDSLDRRERLNYLFARTLIGRDFDRPTVGINATQAQPPS
jgi:hypothetical protein